MNKSLVVFLALYSINSFAGLDDCPESTQKAGYDFMQCMYENFQECSPQLGDKSREIIQKYYALFSNTEKQNCKDLEVTFKSLLILTKKAK